MKADAFQRFETAQSGLLIPVALFLLGMISTVVAVNAIRDVAIAQNAAELNRAGQDGDANGLPVAPDSELADAPATGETADTNTAGANTADAKQLNIESTENNGESPTP